MLDSYFHPQKERELVNWLNEKIGQENFRPGFLRLEKMVSSYKQELEKRNIFIVIIGGTNGKGETSHTLGFHFKEKGIPYGLWTSPHVLSVRERIILNGECISYEALWESLFRSFDQCQQLGVKNPTYYEFMLMVFMDVFLSSPIRPQICLLEVGLGGRNDGVNFFNPHLTAITSISRDHESILGKGYKNILGEKLGITRPLVPLLTALELDYCRQIVLEYTRQHQIPWFDLFKEGICQNEDNYSERNQRLASLLFFFWQKRDFIKDENWKSELVGQWEPNKKVENISPTRGRSDTMTLGSSRIIFIGAHNIDGMRKLKAMSRNQRPYDLLLLSFSRRSLEEIGQILRILALEPPMARKVVVTSFQHDRGMPWSELEQMKRLPEGDLVQWDPQWELLLKSEKANKRNILVAGSYYFVGTVQSWALQNQ